MKAFQLQQINRPRELGEGRGVLGSAIPVSIISIPPLAGLAGVAGAAGVLPGMSPNLWFSLSFIVACAAMAGIAFRLERLVLRQPNSSDVAMLGSSREFIERLEELARDSKRVCVLDRSNITPHLAAAPRFLTAQCAPRSSYRHISSVGGKEEFRSLVHLVRRSAEAERGSYFAVHQHPLVSISTSFCLVERRDGIFTFLIYKMGCGKRANVVLFHDEVFGRRMLGEFDRIWSQLSAGGPPLFDDGALNRAEEKRLLAAWSGGSDSAPRELRAV